VVATTRTRPPSASDCAPSAPTTRWPLTCIPTLCFNVWGEGTIEVILGSALPLAWWVSSGSPMALTTAVAWNLLGCSTSLSR